MRARRKPLWTSPLPADPPIGAQVVGHGREVLALVELGPADGFQCLGCCLTRAMVALSCASDQDGARRRTSGHLSHRVAAPDRPTATAWRGGRSGRSGSVSRPDGPRAAACRRGAAARLPEPGPLPRSKVGGFNLCARSSTVDRAPFWSVQLRCWSRPTTTARLPLDPGGAGEILLDRRTAVRGAAASRGGCPSTVDEKGKELRAPCHS